MKKLLLAFIFVVICLVSCADNGNGTAPSVDGGENTPHHSEPEGKPTPPKIADYASKDLHYTVTLEDGTRSVTMEVSREGVVSTANVIYPESLSGVSVIYDAAGLRVRLPYSEADELTVSDEAASGLAVVFDIMKARPKKDSFTDDGCFSFSVRGILVSLKLSADGMPSEATLERDGSVRVVRFSDFKPY